MENSYKELALDVIIDAIKNVKAKNDYSAHSRRWLTVYTENLDMWCTILGISTTQFMKDVSKFLRSGRPIKTTGKSNTGQNYQGFLYYDCSYHSNKY